MRHLVTSNIVIIVLALFLLVACGGGSSEDNSKTEPSKQSAVAKAYVSEILTIMRNNTVTRYIVDWGKLDSEVNQLAANAQSISDTYPAITRAFELIGTNHSFLNSSSGALITYPSTLTCTQNFDIDTPNVAGIGYIRVDGYGPNNAENTTEFATNIQAKIAQQEREGITAWIVDLRNNQGGNMWPMIAGLGPLFDNSLLGYFADADENFTPWGYENGQSILNGNPVVTVNSHYTLMNSSPKIAVLSSQRVASSGEATLIAFKKQHNVRFFGTDTCGLSTANSSFELSNGSVLFLTTAITTDREQEKYGGRVSVDQLTTPETLLTEAISWLQE